MADELLYYLGLTKIPKVGPVTAKNLVSYCGGAEAVFKASKKQLLAVPGIGPGTADEILKQSVLSVAESDLKKAEENGTQLISYLSPDYPQRLKHFPDCPVVLYYKGKADLNANKIVAIVGTRKPTDYGRTVCEKLVEELKAYDVIVVSGLAYGIDITAHKKCVDVGLPTIGVMGSGLDIVYPAAHRKIAREMMERGGLLSEFSYGTPPDREHFPMRNRIVAGMCDALVVVETKRRGGSMITANLANDYNKDVFAYPGRNSDEFSEGCNLLIKSHQAALLDGAKDLAYVMQWEAGKINTDIQRSLFIELNNEEEKLVKLLKENPKMAVDQITAALSKTPSEMASLLLNLEFKGVIKSLPGKRYMLI